MGLMAMPRILSQSVFLHRPTALISHRRHRSNKSYGGRLIEIDLDSASSSGEEVITGGIKKLEEAIHGMIVRRAAPDWLPFLPGYSYWVPPSRGSMFEKLAGVTRTQGNELLSEDEHLSSASPKGWPSSSFFIHGILPKHPTPVAEMEVKIQDNEDHTSESNSDDEQG
ncbi:hypothetical protein ACJIZ3_021645 [Penstemon smallii]|uniref:Uncharacterized protein n=1 Tax=Penstemon smallii TaxID=265156 RepID=A0ABD3SMJ7_9LAMI